MTTNPTLHQKRDGSPHCGRCGYSPCGLASPINDALVLCPECGHNGPPGGRPSKLARAANVLWKGGRLLFAFVLLLVILVLSAMYMGDAAQQPFQNEIANSDLVPEEYRGRLGAFVDMSQWTLQVQEQTFAASGGWSGVWRPPIIGAFVMLGVGGIALGAGLVMLTSIRGRWIISIPVVPALAISLWMLNAFEWARATSPSTGNYASVLAGERVGTPAAYATAVWMTAGVVAGCLLTLVVRARRHRPLLHG